MTAPRIAEVLIDSDRELIELWHHSPEFKAGITLVERLLPKTVRMIAEDAKEAQRSRYLMAAKGLALSEEALRDLRRDTQ